MSSQQDGSESTREFLNDSSNKWKQLEYRSWTYSPRSTLGGIVRVCIAPNRASRKHVLNAAKHDPVATWWYVDERVAFASSLHSSVAFPSPRTGPRRRRADPDEADAYAGDGSETSRSASRRRYLSRNSIRSDNIARCKLPPTVCGSSGSPPTRSDGALRTAPSGDLSPSHFASLGFNEPHAGLRIL